MSILVTGGAGYIGSHVVRYLIDAGRQAVVVDNLLTGHRDAVPSDVPFLEADIADGHRVARFLHDHKVDSVMHFAARSQVAESVEKPRLYFRGNLAATISLLETVLDGNISSFVFSSTAAVYGNPEHTPIPENHPTAPINPYGASKLAIEGVLAEYSRAYGLKYAALRYFNAAGALPKCGLGERHDPESHLIPIVLDVALGKRKAITIYGNDYGTPDGTCVRDYIHVMDLAEAHLGALDHLRRGMRGGAFNLGTGIGCSVQQVVDTARQVTERPIAVAMGPRRPGDPPILVAGPERAFEEFGFRARRSSLLQILKDAWTFHSR